MRVKGRDEGGIGAELHINKLIHDQPKPDAICHLFKSLPFYLVAVFCYGRLCLGVVRCRLLQWVVVR